MVVQVLEGDNAIAKYREVMGATDPAKAADGTIRKLHAKSVGENSVHGSDSAENCEQGNRPVLLGNETAMMRWLTGIISQSIGREDTSVGSSGGLWADFAQPAFWVAAGQIIWINILLSGDNAVVIALACRSLPPRQRFWGIMLGAGVAVLLRIFFTLMIAQTMGFPFLKLVGGLLLLWIAVKLVVPSEEHGEDKVKAGDTLCAPSGSSRSPTS